MHMNYKNDSKWNVNDLLKSLKSRYIILFELLLLQQIHTHLYDENFAFACNFSCTKKELTEKFTFLHASSEWDFWLQG